MSQKNSKPFSSICWTVGLATDTITVRAQLSLEHQSFCWVARGKMPPERWFNQKTWEIVAKLYGENWWFCKPTWLEIGIFSSTAYLSVEKASWRCLLAFPGYHSVDSSWVPVSSQACIAVRWSTKHTVICRNAPLGTRLVEAGWLSFGWIHRSFLPQGEEKGKKVLFDTSRNEKTQSGHSSPPMPKFHWWLW